MANINSMFITLNVNSSPMDVLNKKIEAVTSKLVTAASSLDKTMSKMMIVSNQAAVASTQLNNAGSSINKVSKNLATVSGNMDNTATKMTKVSGTTQKMINDMSGVGKTVNNVNVNITQINSTMNNTVKMAKGSVVINKFANAISNVGKKSTLANNKVAKLIKSMGLFKKENFKKAADIYDKFTNTTTQLGSVKKGSTSKEELQDKVFAAADRSRGNFTDMAGTVTKLERSTGDVFKSNDETIAFTELTQKSLVASGASPEDRKSGMDKITDVMAAGKLDASGLKDISKTAPLIYEAISKFTKKSGAELIALAEAGQISSGDIKNAMFAMSGEINKKFSDTPMTFADIWTSIKDTGLQAFSGIFMKIQELISSNEFQSFLSELVEGFKLIADVALFLIDSIISGWDIIGPILGIIAGLYLISMIASLWGMIPPLIAMIPAIFAVAWPILLILGIIGVVIGVVRALGVSWEEIFGFMGGVIGVFGATFFNIIISLYNIVASFINFLGNAFNDPISSILILFGEFAIQVLGYFENILKGIQDFLSYIGIDIDLSFMGNMKNSILDKVNEQKENMGYKDFMPKKDLVDLGNAASMGGDKAANLYKSMAGTGEKVDPASNQGPQFDPEKFSSKSNPAVVEGTGPGGNVNVDMPDEDISFLRDIAERDYIANIASNSLAPNISIKFGDVHENADAQKIAGRIQRILQEEIAIASEGVY